MLSRTIYIAQVLPCPENISSQILGAIVRFIWLKFVEKPQRSVVFRKIPEGGLSPLLNPARELRYFGLVDIENVSFQRW